MLMALRQPKYSATISDAGTPKTVPTAIPAIIVDMDFPLLALELRRVEAVMPQARNAPAETPAIARNIINEINSGARMLSSFVIINIAR